LLNFVAMRNEKESFYPPRSFAGVSSPYADWDKALAVILPVPYDSTTEWHSGTREGPRAIIDASQYLELYDSELGCEIHKVGIHTLPEVQPSMNSPQETIDRVYALTKVLVNERKLVVMLGGEHSVSLGVVKAFAEKFPKLSVLQLDAHADLKDEYLGTKYSHACVMRRIFEICPVVQVGVRSLSWEEQQFLNQSKIKFTDVSKLTTEPNCVENIIPQLSEDVYVTIDLDVFDPSLMPAVGTPEPGGLGWQEIIGLLRAVALERHIVGFDIVELCPREGPASCAFVAAKLAYKFIGYIGLKEGRWEVP